MEYILGIKDEGCILCEKERQKNDKKNYILERGKTCYVVLNKYPYNTGHLMIAPYRHVSEIEELNNDESTELMNLIKKFTRVLKKVFKPHGFNIGINIGRVAGAGIDKHIHIHIVPRWSADSNFMPVISDTKVIPELLETTYQRIKEKL